jgi:polyhydroxyalkanoate synthesis regulator phasin
MPFQEPTSLEQFLRNMFEDMKAKFRSSKKQIVAKISRKLEEVFEKTKQEIKCMEQWLYKKLTKKLDGMTKNFLQLH